MTHDIASLIRTSVLLAAQGWREHDDTDTLRYDPAFRLAASSVAVLTPLEVPGLASQPIQSSYTTQRRIFEVHNHPAKVRIFEDSQLVASHPVLEGKNQRRVDASHRKPIQPARRAVQLTTSPTDAQVTGCAIMPT